MDPDPRWEKIRIRDKDPGSATLGTTKAGGKKKQMYSWQEAVLPCPLLRQLVVFVLVGLVEPLNRIPH